MNSNSVKKTMGLQKGVATKLEQIENILFDSIQKNPQTRPNVSMATGASGISLFFFTRYQQTQESKYLTAANHYLELAVNHMHTCKLLTYCGGLAGVGWLIEYLAYENLIDAETNDILNELDIVLESEMIKSFDIGNYDFLHGALGYAYYFLGRKGHPRRSDILRSVVLNLKKIA